MRTNSEIYFTKQWWIDTICYQTLFIALAAIDMWCWNKMGESSDRDMLAWMCNDYCNIAYQDSMTTNIWAAASLFMFVVAFIIEVLTLENIFNPEVFELEEGIHKE